MTKKTFLFSLLALCLMPAMAQTTFIPGVSGLGFGGTVSASGNEIVVGYAATGWPRGDEPAGAVFVFAKDASGQWVETTSLQAPDGGVGDDFGRTVFMKGNTIVVGAPGMNAAYVFERNSAGTWQDAGKLMPKELQEGFEFGGAYARAGSRTANIAMAGAQVVVTSYNGTTQNGLAHVFGKRDGAWVETDVFSAHTAKDGDGFAMSVAANDANIFVTAPGSMDGKGQVYVFMDHGQWMQMGSLNVSGDGPASLGASISVANGKVYVGAPALDKTGAVLVYEMQPSGLYGQVGKVTAPEGDAAVARFGSAISASGNHLYVASRGRVHAFEVGSGLNDTFDAPDQRAQPGFGIGIASNDDLVVVGSPSADYEAGIASVFERQGNGEWALTGTLAS